MAKTPPLQSDLVQITWALNLYRLATNIVGVFIPFIIINSGGKIWTIGLFYLLYALIKLSLNYSYMRIIQSRGAHFGLGMAFASSALQIISILGYSRYHAIALLIVAAAGFASTNGFLWNSQHYFISRYMNDKSKSSSIASIEVYGRLTDIAGPIIGGVIGAAFGTGWLLFAVLLCLLITVLPLRRMSRLPSKPQSNETFSYSLKGTPKGDLIANFSFNIETLIGKMAWPIYLAISLHNYKSIGGVAAIAAVASIVTTSIAGHRGDRGKDRSVLKQGVVVASIIDVARLLATTTSLIYVVSAAYQASLAYFVNSWVSTYYHHAQKKGAQYIISMEIANDLAYIFFWGIFFVLSITIHSTKTLFDIVFLIAAIAAYGCLFISRQNTNSD